MILQLRSTITYLHQSNIADALLHIAMRELSITRSIEAIGKTQFATVYWSSASLQRNLPAIHQVVTAGAVALPVSVVLLSDNY